MKSRRKFIVSLLSAAAGTVLIGCKNATNKNDKSMNGQFENLSYCCIPCDERCEAYNATKNNDQVIKAKLAKRWSAKDGIEYRIDQVRCFGCKNEDPNNNPRLQKCTVRQCAKEKSVISCAHCQELAECDKELWITWPKLKDNALKIQQELQV